MWSEWTNPETGKLQNPCTMVITEPNKFLAKVHDRMPVILEERQFDAWLDESAVLPANPAAECVSPFWRRPTIWAGDLLR
jgi:putative SOS response-associated peptidase YedK